MYDVPVVSGKHYPAHSGYLGKLDRLGEVSVLPTEGVLLKLECRTAPKTFKHRFLCDYAHEIELNQVVLVHYQRVYGRENIKALC